jgi:hypothetical protein
MNDDDRSFETEPTEAWIERIRDTYAPDPMSAAQRRSFNVGLEERLSAHRRKRWQRYWQPIAAATCAAAALWWMQTPGTTPQSTPSPSIEPATLAALHAWEIEVLASSEFANFESQPLSELLPGEYQALAGIVLASED